MGEGRGGGGREAGKRGFEEQHKEKKGCDALGVSRREGNARSVLESVGPQGSARVNE